MRLEIVIELLNCDAIREAEIFDDLASLIVFIGASLVAGVGEEAFGRKSCTLGSHVFE